MQIITDVCKLCGHNIRAVCIAHMHQERSLTQKLYLSKTLRNIKCAFDSVLQIDRVEYVR